MNKKTISVIVVVVVIAIIGYAFGARKSVPKVNVGSSGTQPTSLFAENYIPAIQYNGGYNTQLPIASVASTSQMTIFGITQQYQRQAFSTGTSTLCSLLSPTATSTLEYFSALVTTASTTAYGTGLSTSTVPYAPFASTTLLTFAALPANNPFFFYQPSINGLSVGGNQANSNATSSFSVLAPSTYVVFWNNSPSGAGTNIGGVCTAKFTTLN